MSINSSLSISSLDQPKDLFPQSIMPSYTFKTIRDMATKEAGGLTAILKPHHSTKASIEAFSLSQNFITEKQYLNTTFSTMVEVQRNGMRFIQKPIVMFFRETKDELYEDMHRIFSLQGEKFHMSAHFESLGTIRFESDIEPLIRLLMTRDGADRIVVFIRLWD